MTKTTLLLAVLLALPTAFAQSPAPAPAAPQGTSAPAKPEPLALAKFSLDFRGGTPGQLIVAIEKAMSKPVNAIILPEYADTKLPPLRMNNVNVQQLFQALEYATLKTEMFPNYGGNSYQQWRTSLTFKTQGPLSDESVWYFSAEKPAVPPAQPRTSPKVCRYFALAPYLDRGQTVDDITTAIQTGWKMLGEEDTPKISFHKETKLLIAVGDPDRLETIDAVLQALKSSSAPKSIDPATGMPLHAPTTTKPVPQRGLKTPTEIKPPGDSNQ